MVSDEMIYMDFRTHVTLYRVSQKKIYTFEMAAEWKIFDSGENDLHVWIAYGPQLSSDTKTSKNNSCLNEHCSLM